MSENPEKTALNAAHDALVLADLLIEGIADACEIDLQDTTINVTARAKDGAAVKEITVISAEGIVEKLREALRLVDALRSIPEASEA